MQSSQGPGSYQTRKPSHAGSWYTDDPDDLDAELTEYLSKAQKNIKEGEHLKGIIGPHAGYSYSGPTAAWAYINIDPAKYKRIILLGPSHHVYLDNCALTQSKAYGTPFGDLTVDLAGTQQLFQHGTFQYMSKRADEDEHSLEMHIPYLKKIFKDHPEVVLLPIMVGNLKAKSEQEFGKILAPFIQDPQTLFVISSDFCHWGRNFDYCPQVEEKGEQIWQGIEKMDKMGMDLIEAQDPSAFDKYLKETDNTICGRHPIAVFLNALKESGLETQTRFAKYAQSNQVKNKNDMSVSYASSVTVVRQ